MILLIAVISMISENHTQIMTIKKIMSITKITVQTIKIRVIRVLSRHGFLTPTVEPGRVFELCWKCHMGVPGLHVGYHIVKKHEKRVEEFFETFFTLSSPCPKMLDVKFRSADEQNEFRIFLHHKGTKNTKKQLLKDSFYGSSGMFVELQEE
jgi:hypothetical protein